MAVDFPHTTSVCTTLQTSHRTTCRGNFLLWIRTENDFVLCGNGGETQVSTGPICQSQIFQLVGKGFWVWMKSKMPTLCREVVEVVVCFLEESVRKRVTYWFLIYSQQWSHCQNDLKSPIDLSLFPESHKFCWIRLEQKWIWHFLGQACEETLVHSAALHRCSPVFKARSSYSSFRSAGLQLCSFTSSVFKINPLQIWNNGRSLALICGGFS